MTSQHSAHPPAPRPAPLPLLLLAGLHAVLACVLVLAGLPAAAAALALAVVLAAQVTLAERLVLRRLGVRRPLPAEAAGYEELRRTLEATAATAGTPVPALLVAAGDPRDGRPARTVARSRRSATVVVAPSLLTAGPAAREAALARAVAELELGDAVAHTVAGVPAAVGLAPLSRLLLAPGARRRAALTDEVAARLAEALRTGAPTGPAVPYRDFVRA